MWAGYISGHKSAAARFKRNVQEGVKSIQTDLQASRTRHCSLSARRVGHIDKTGGDVCWSESDCRSVCREAAGRLELFCVLSEHASHQGLSAPMAAALSSLSGRITHN